MASATIVVSFLILCFVPQTTCSTNQTDLLSLLAFKFSLADSQGALNSWNETLDFCSWKGIQCSGGRVVVINLTSQGLTGTLSPYIGNLSFLTTIILQNNSFHGPIPQEISHLTRLEFVEFSNNSYTGSIPTNLSHCVYLNLIDNKLSGTIPTELGFMSKLEALGLSKNKLSGHIPPSIGNLTSLSKLSLRSCGLEGRIPESFAQLHNLTFLQLQDNGLTGTIHSGIFNLSNLQLIGVASNELHGIIPSDIGLTLPNLRNLFLWGNQFTGPIPESISNASFLINAILASNYFTGPLPRVERLTHLQEFVLETNLIADDISFISSLANSTELQALHLGENLLTGSLPDSIANLSHQLNRLHLHSNKIHGNIPSSIGDLIGLTSVNFSNNYLVGPIPVAISKLSNLHQISFERNRLANEIPSSFGNLTSLDSLILNENSLSGAIPPSLGNCTHLLEVDLSENNFNGLIPPNLLTLSSISVVFNLSYNALEGSIPYEVGSLTNLAMLDLSNNKLSGLIPNSLSHCLSLQQLYLGGNLLEGEIPSQLSVLMGLQYLDLSRNNLSGSIPSSLGKLNLEKLNLSFNKLQGEVPTTGVFKSQNKISLVGNKELCGGIWELKLPPCSSIKRNSLALLKILIPTLVIGGMCLLLALYYIKFASKQRRSPRNQASNMPSSIGLQFIRVSYADLFKATNGFFETNLLGVGRYGSVYKGILNDGQTRVAVKVLNLFVRGAFKSFMAECNTLRDVKHRNLLKILSICESIDFHGNDFKALIYEFKANGSLEKWLHCTSKKEEEQDLETSNIKIIQRLKIATDIAQALEYLHFGTNASIIHGDLKPSNILLDDEMNACVGDFGLAKIISDIVPIHENNSSIGIRGTLGYVPPEYGTSHTGSTQGDAYSYGIVLLEMFTRKRPTDDLFENHVNLHNFVHDALPDRVMEIVDPLFKIDPSIEDGKMKDLLASILSIGVSCSNEMPKARMTMTDVVNKLQKIEKLCC